MAIADDKTIVGISDRAAKARDTISSILERESRPSFGDQMKAATARFRQNIFDASKPTESADDVFQKRIASEISNPAANYKLLSEAAKGGSTRIQSLLSTFEKFADTPESMAQLIKAAADDPQEIDESNAAVWAAKKSQELGLQSYKGSMAKSQLLFAQNKYWQNADGSQGYDPFSTQPSENTKTTPDAMPLIQSSPGKVLLPPPDEASAPKVKEHDQNGKTFDQLYPGFRERIKYIRSNPKTAGYAIDQKYMGLISSPKYQERGQDLSRMLISSRAIEDAVEKSKGKTGWLVGDIWKKVDNDVQYLAAMQAKFAPGNREPGSGATSDFDASQLLLGSPGPDKKYEVNKKLISFYKELAKSEMEQRSNMQRFFTRFKTNENFEGIYNEYVNQNPILDPSKPGSFELNPNRQDFMEWLDGFVSGKIKVGGKKQSQKSKEQGTSNELLYDIDANLIGGK